MRFVDTNVLLYFASRSAADVQKSEIARSIVYEGNLALSVQVLQEFYVQATRASRRDPLTHRQAALLIEGWLRFPVQAINSEIFISALSTKERYRISYWDAAIIESALAAGCDVILTEDLNHGQHYRGVRVVNPFLATDG
jgi:predicted nucleic acid-binding protein